MRYQHHMLKLKTNLNKIVAERNSIIKYEEAEKSVQCTATKTKKVNNQVQESSSVRSQNQKSPEAASKFNFVTSI